MIINLGGAILRVVTHTLIDLVNVETLHSPLDDGVLLPLI